ncbi:recombinase family protein [uncultured Micrococcus sp.]|uniref:recombinase family protein n=1 Tax=uncultured Micrococcus sp. TaxID=114051 RepID=UPI0025940B3F|nr:recombinase family protein [uncultured Micrococcus sp.]
MTNPRAGIYARISRDMQGERLGVDRQLEACRDLAQRMDLEVVDEYVDNDLSAMKSRRRPEYDRLVQDIEASALDAVIVWDHDRLLRQTKELERFIDVCDPRGVPTYTVTSGKLDLSTPTGRAVAKTRGAWAQHESEHRAERIRAQKVQAARAGKHIGGPAPFGWRRVDHVVLENGKHSGGRFIVDEKNGRMIREGTEMILKGHTLGDVARLWAAEGIRGRTGRTLTTTQVKQRLLRARNAGLLTFHGETVSDGWPPIVSLEDFRALEAILTAPERRQSSEAKFKYLLSGIAHCHCGRVMHGLHRKSRGRIYRCTVSFEHGTDREGHTTRRMEPLDEHVLAAAAAHLSDPATVEAWRTVARPAGAEPGVDETAALLDLTNRRNALTRLFAQGALSETQLVEGTAELNAQVDRIQAEVQRRSRSRALASMLVQDDPAAAFLAAPVVTQREALRALLWVEVLPTVNRGVFDPDAVRLHWRGAPDFQEPNRSPEQKMRRVTGTMNPEAERGDDA